MVSINSSDALVLLDLQNLFVSARGDSVPSAVVQAAQARCVVANAAAVLANFRRRGRPVFHVRLGFRPDYADALSVSPRATRLRQSGAAKLGTWDTQFPAALEPTDGELVITKACVNPFFNTPLMALLHKRGVKEVVLGGVATNMVVESAARYAEDAGFAVTVLEDLCAAADPVWHRHAIEQMLPLFGSVMSSLEYMT